MRNNSSFLFGYIAIALITILGINFWDDELVRALSLFPHTIDILSVAISFFVFSFFWISKRESDAIKNEFMTIVTHKFRTPLTAIGWITESLRNVTSKDEKEELLSQLKRATGKLEEIANLLVNFTKFDKRLEYNYRIVALDEIIKEAVKNSAQMIREKGILLATDLPASLSPILADEMKLQFAIDTILDNAIKYTPKGGAIEIKALEDSKHIRVSIIDSGIGIRSEDLRKVAKRFFRTKEARRTDASGLGLGLFMAQTIAREHGARFSIESKGENRGTTIIFEFSKQEASDNSKLSRT